MKEEFKIRFEDIPGEMWENLEAQADGILKNAKADIVLWENVKKQIQEFKKKWEKEHIGKEKEKSTPLKRITPTGVG
jgi:hypothetical protein